MKKLPLIFMFCLITMLLTGCHAAPSASLTEIPAPSFSPAGQAETPAEKSCPENWNDVLL